MMLYSMLHTIVSPITKGIYRMRVIGTEYIPATGKNDFVQQPQICYGSYFVGD